ncbi:SDR family NAD(P)-dependent oxidoreductase [Nocardia sp. NEAU-G5]|uniref:SDR family NAD(P)-dependent oxidoreductase n=1 Tax=Nocardia albiluteola TaxID=2842303 RepID=A0ABS6AYG6_9NOCA|nr:SDR family NAD(P)-dependent oxidoreductase [Nocardia albiluteola]MBU3062068.1 SDR family NAD(P)-dependent oxidoreductase [Nocardia albiluteola]
MGVRVDEGAIVLLGGRSEIGLEIVRRCAAGRVVILAARRSDELARERAAAEDAGAAAVHCVEFDADDLAAHQPLLEKIAAEHGRIGAAVLAFGVLGDQARAEQDPAAAVAVLQTDFVAQVGLLTILANMLRAQGSGHLVVFSSVAGFRVRRANYVYGSGKAGLDGFATGLADALHGTGVHLLLVRSGFVIGRMTEGMDPAPFSVRPGQVADAVLAGLRARREIAWAPAMMRPIYFVSRFVPRAIWRRLPR